MAHIQQHLNSLLQLLPIILPQSSPPVTLQTAHPLLLRQTKSHSNRQAPQPDSLPTHLQQNAKFRYSYSTPDHIKFMALLNK